MTKKRDWLDVPFRDGRPHNLRRPKHDAAYLKSWFYSDSKGVTVVVAGRLARLPWTQLKAAARREGLPAPTDGWESR